MVSTCRNVVIHAQPPWSGPSEISISCPVICLDPTRCGHGSSVDGDNLCLYNTAIPGWNPPQPNLPFRFKGTCSTACLPAQTCYWQAVCHVQPKPRLRDNIKLCELGLATHQALNLGVDLVTPTNRSAVALTLCTRNGSLVAQTFCKKQEIVSVALCNSVLTTASERTFGFLLDRSNRRFFIIDVSSSQLLCQCSVEMESSLWPFVNMAHNMGYCGAEVKVTMQSGPEVTITYPLAKVIYGAMCKR